MNEGKVLLRYQIQTHNFCCILFGIFACITFWCLFVTRRWCGIGRRSWRCTFGHIGRCIYGGFTLIRLLLSLGITKLNPTHVDRTETEASDARRPKIKVLVQIVIEYRIQIDKLAIEHWIECLLDGRRAQPALQFRRPYGVVDNTLQEIRIDFIKGVSQSHMQ